MTSIHHVLSKIVFCETFGMDIWINCLYYDPKVQENPTKYRKGEYIAPEDALEKLDWDYFPLPHLFNNRDFEKEIDTYILIYDEPEIGSVLISRRYVGTFSETCRIEAFPFDSHLLRVKMFFNDCYKLHYSNDMP